jgi:2-furoyl-CoA dehydrogenase FAD binding subunit
MKPAAFDYVRADALSEAVALLGEYGEDARILAGGQSLMAVLNIRLAAPKLLIDISRAADVDYSRVNKGYLEVGAAATQASVEWRPGLADEVPLLKLAFPLISHFQIRNKGTVCGSIAHADPSAELPLCLTALEGEVVLRAKRGQRVLKAEEFFQGMLMTARRPDEVVEAVRFPLRSSSARYAFDEVSMRHGDFALVAIAAVVNADSIAFAVGGVADRPVLRRWPKLKGADLDTALNDFAWELDAQDDHHASAQYRRHLVRKMGRRLVEEAA